MNPDKQSFEQKLTAVKGILDEDSAPSTSGRSGVDAAVFFFFSALILALIWFQMWPELLSQVRLHSPFKGLIECIALVLGLAALSLAASARRGSLVVASLAAVAASCWMLSTALNGSGPTAGGQPRGVLVARSEAPDATLFFRRVGAEKWRIADCSPQVKVSLAPGTYQVRIVGVGERAIVKEREVQLLPGQQADVAPD